MALHRLMKNCPEEKQQQVALLVSEHLSTGGFAEEDIGELNSVIEGAYDNLNDAAKLQISENLASSTSTSNSLALRLAEEDVGIAAPILTRSPVLTTENLKMLVRKKGQAHRLAIANRDVLEREVTDLLIALGDNQVKLTVCSNLGADIAPEDFDRLLRAMPEKMGNRIGHLRKSNEMLVQDLMRDKEELVLGSELTVVLNAAIPFENWLMALELGQTSLNTALSRMCTEKNLYDVVSLLSVLTGMSHEDVTCLMLRTDATGVAILCKILGVGTMEYAILCRARCAHLRLPQFVGDVWASNFNIMSPEDAKRLYGLLLLKLQTAQNASVSSQEAASEAGRTLSVAN